MKPFDEILKALDAIPITEAEVEIWMAECDAGLHQLSEGDLKALNRSWEMIKEDWTKNGPEQSFPA